MKKIVQQNTITFIFKTNWESYFKWCILHILLITAVFCVNEAQFFMSSKVTGIWIWHMLCILPLLLHIFMPKFQVLCIMLLLSNMESYLGPVLKIMDLTFVFFYRIDLTIVLNKEVSYYYLVLLICITCSSNFV
jgi:hypothetical protein